MEVHQEEDMVVHPEEEVVVHQEAEVEAHQDLAPSLGVHLLHLVDLRQALDLEGEEVEALDLEEEVEIKVGVLDLIVEEVEVLVSLEGIMDREMEVLALEEVMERKEEEEMEAGNKGEEA